jgi:hypothetical protein
MSTAASASASRTFYKLDIQGIVYLIDPATSIAYTYDLTNPTEIGHLQWTDPAAKPTLQLRSDWADIMAAKMTAHQAHIAVPVHDAAPTTTSV